MQVTDFSAVTAALVHARSANLPAEKLTALTKKYEVLKIEDIKAQARKEQADQLAKQLALAKQQKGGGRSALDALSFNVCTFTLLVVRALGYSCACETLLGKTCEEIPRRRSRHRIRNGRRSGWTRKNGNPRRARYRGQGQNLPRS